MTVAIAKRLSAGVLRSHLLPHRDEETLFGDSGVMLDSICASTLRQHRIPQWRILQREQRLCLYSVTVSTHGAVAKQV